MTPERYAEVRDVFLNIREMPAEQQAETLRSIDDAALVSEVKSLLESDLRCDGFLERTAGPKRGASTENQLETIHHCFGPMPLAAIPTQAGAFTIGDQIGAGGFGSVHRGHQTTPITRDVAIKLIKPGMDSAAVLTRFEAERQVLAMMDHPFIAKVFDAGTTDSGSPYFAMELVEGEPIDEYCDSRKINLEDRLRLFVDVCRAVHHAHQKGIIHRDIKPSNVLVSESDGEPVPKVIDFGIAKAVQSGFSMASDSNWGSMTQQGQLLGTLEYMSPEQAEMVSHRVETRSDVYSLGALLYKLLTGVAPISREHLLSDGVWQVHKRLMAVTVPPLTRSTSLAPGVHASPPQDLNLIVLKALEKEPHRRYESVNDFQADVQRHLNQLPIVARPPSTSYRIRLFLRRHRIAAMASAVTILACVVGLAGLVTGFRAATQARDVAIDERRRADSTAIELRRAMYDDWVQTGWQAAYQRQHMKAAEYLDKCSKQQRGWEWDFADSLRRDQPFDRLHLGGQVSPTIFDFDSSTSSLVGVSNESTAVWFDLDHKGTAEVFDSNAIVTSTAQLSEHEAAVGTADGRLFKWDRTNKTQALETPLNAGGIYAIASSPDGQSLAVTTGGGYLIHLSTETLAELRRWQLPSRSAAVTFALGGKSIFAGGLDGRLTKITPVTGATETFSISRSGIVDIVIDSSTDTAGQRLWMISDNRVLTFDVAFETVATMLDGGMPISKLTRASNGHWVLGRRDGTISVFDQATNRERVLTQFDAAVMDLRWDDSADRVVVSLADAQVISLPIVDGQAGWNKTFPAGIFATTILPLKNQIAIVDGGGTLSLFDARTGQPKGRVDSRHGDVWSLSVAKDESFIATVGDDQRLRVWDLPDLSLRFERPIAWGARAIAVGGSGESTWIVAAPDPSQSASSINEGTLGIYDPADGKMTGVLKGHQNWVMTLCVEPGSDRLVSGCENQTLRLWDVAQQKQLARFDSPGQDVAVTLLIDPVDEVLYSGHRNGELNVWDLSGTNRIQTVQAFGNELTTLRLVDDRIVAASSLGESVIVWKQGSRQSLDPVTSLEFDDGTLKQLHTDRNGQTVFMAGERTIEVIPVQRPTSLAN